MSQTKNIIVIPARTASTRLSRKLLASAAGKPVLRHTWERCIEVEGVDKVFVASGDQEILDCCDAWQMDQFRTRKEHPNGTSRAAEAVEGLALAADSNIVIVQGDEPEIAPHAVSMLFRALKGGAAPAATLACPLVSEAEWHNPNRVKVVMGDRNLAVYFSRAAIADWRTARRHIGTYAYRLPQLFQVAALPPGALELAENLEQLRFLASGGRMEVCELDSSHPGIDTLEDLEAFRRRVEVR